MGPQAATSSSAANPFNLIIYIILPVFIFIYSIYRYCTLQSSAGAHRNSTSRSSDSIPDVKERMRLFNERKAALIAKAKETYLKKQAVEAAKKAD